MFGLVKINILFGFMWIWFLMNLICCFIIGWCLFFIFIMWLWLSFGLIYLYIFVIFDKLIYLLIDVIIWFNNWSLWVYVLVVFLIWLNILYFSLFVLFLEDKILFFVFFKFFVI